MVKAPRRLYRNGDVYVLHAIELHVGSKMSFPDVHKCIHAPNKRACSKHEPPWNTERYFTSPKHSTPWLTSQRGYVAVHALYFELAGAGIGFPTPPGVHSKGSGGAASSPSGSVEGASTNATSSGSSGVRSNSMMMPSGFPDFRTGAYLNKRCEKERDRGVTERAQAICITSIRTAAGL